jgi:hypothetical protein
MNAKPPSSWPFWRFIAKCLVFEAAIGVAVVWLAHIWNQ